MTTKRKTVEKLRAEYDEAVRVWNVLGGQLNRAHIAMEKAEDALYEAERAIRAKGAKP